MKIRKKREIQSIPVAAMGDIAFLLLIFYIATTMLTDQKPIDIKLPELTTEVQNSPYPLIIYANQDLISKNKIYFFNEEVSIELLHQKLLEKINSPYPFRVYLNIEKDIAFKHMYRIIQELKKAGIRNLVISTRPKNNE